MLDARDIKFLRAIERRSKVPGDGVAARLPLSEYLESLIKRGYLRAVKLYQGPLGMPLEEPGMRLTEAGEFVLRRTDEA